jgi:hypothetical protein
MMSNAGGVGLSAFAGDGFEEVGDRYDFNGRYALLRWEGSSGTITADHVRVTLEGKLPLKTAVFGSVVGEGAEVRALIHLGRRVHYSNAKEHFSLARSGVDGALGFVDETIWIRKIDKANEVESFVADAEEYVTAPTAVGSSQLFGSVIGVPEVDTDARDGPELVDEGRIAGGGPVTAVEAGSSELHAEGVDGLSELMAGLQLKRDIAVAEEEVAQAKVSRLNLELEMQELRSKEKQQQRRG